MAQLNFKWGQFNNLAAAEKKAGTIYVTTDERAMYLDISDSQRIRLGDFLEYASVEALRNDNKNWDTSTLVYIKYSNILAKYIQKDDGTYEWKTINDTAALVADIATNADNIAKNTADISLINTNLGNVTNRVANTESRLDNIESIIGDAESGNSILDRLDSAEDRLDSAEGRLDSAEGRLSGHDTQITNIGNTITDIQNDITNDVKARIGSLETAIGSETVANSILGRLKTDEQDISDLKKTAQSQGQDISKNQGEIASLKTNLADAVGRITTAEGKITTAEGKIAAAEGRLTTAEGKITTAEGKITSIQDSIGSVTKEGSILYRIADAEDEISGHSTQITNLNTKIDENIGNLRAEIEQNVQAADAMTFKGVITAYSDLPIGDETIGEGEDQKRIYVNAGDTYKVGSKIVVSATETWYVGDLVIAKVDQAKTDSTYNGGWWHISSGYEDDYNAYLDFTTTNTLSLKGGAGEAKGSLQFATATGSESLGVSVAKSTSSDDTAVITFGLSWGTF